MFAPEPLDLTEDSDTISRVIFNTIGDSLCCSGWDGKVHLWSWPSKKRQTTFFFDDPVLDVTWKDNTILAANCDGSISQIDVSKGSTTTIGSHDDAVRSVRWLPARNLVVTAGSDIKHWDLRAGDNPVRTLKLEGRVWAMDHADDTLVACTSNYSVNVYKMGAPDRVFRTIDNPISTPTTTVSVFRNGSGYAIGSVEGRCAIRFTESDLDGSKAYIFKCQRKQGPLGSEAYPVNVVEWHPTKPHVFVVSGGLGSYTFFEKDAKLRLKDYDCIDGDYATRRVRDSITAGAWHPTGEHFVYAHGYDWTMGHEGFAKRLPTRLLVHNVKPADIAKN